ncbi:MAG: hypothetical protein KDK26_00445 [Roseivivax sp.]|nr:hypothetical protein [Roseivivax sp.]
MPIASNDNRIYLSTLSGAVYAWDFGTGQTQLIANTGIQLTDIAIAPDGTLYGITFTRLYRIDTATGFATDIGPLSSPSELYFGVSSLTQANGFDISPTGVGRITSADNTLAVHVDLATGQVSNTAGPVLGRATSAGDIWFVNDTDYEVSTLSYTIANVVLSQNGREVTASTDFVSANNIWGLAEAPVAGYGVSAGTRLGFVGSQVYNLSPGNTALGPGLTTLPIYEAVSGVAMLRSGSGGTPTQPGTPTPPVDPTLPGMVVYQPFDIKDSYITNVYNSLDSDSLLVGGWGDLYHSFIEFDLSTLPDAVDAVTLRLYVSQQPASP